MSDHSTPKQSRPCAPHLPTAGLLVLLFAALVTSCGQRALNRGHAVEGLHTIALGPGEASDFGNRGDSDAPSHTVSVLDANTNGGTGGCSFNLVSVTDANKRADATTLNTVFTAGDTTKWNFTVPAAKAGDLLFTIRSGATVLLNDSAIDEIPTAPAAKTFPLDNGDIGTYTYSARVVDHATRAQLCDLGATTFTVQRNQGGPVFTPPIGGAGAAAPYSIDGIQATPPNGTGAVFVTIAGTLPAPADNTWQIFLDCGITLHPGDWNVTAGKITFTISDGGKAAGRSCKISIADKKGNQSESKQFNITTAGWSSGTLTAQGAGNLGGGGVDPTVCKLLVDGTQASTKNPNAFSFPNSIKVTRSGTAIGPIWWSNVVINPNGVMAYPAPNPPEPTAPQPGLEQNGQISVFYDAAHGFRFPYASCDPTKTLCPNNALTQPAQFAVKAFVKKADGTRVDCPLMINAQAIGEVPVWNFQVTDY